MSKIISVIGPSSSGKTTVSQILSLGLIKKNGSSIIVSNNDLVTLYNQIFGKSDDDISSPLYPVILNEEKNNVQKHILSKKSSPNIGYLAFTKDDFSYKYPSPNQDNISAFISSILGLSNYIVFDLNDKFDNFSEYALSISDYLIILSTPDIKSMMYHYNMKEYYNSLFKGNKEYKVLNKTEKREYFPYEKLEYDSIIPYSEKIKETYYNFNMTAYKYPSEVKRIENIIKEIQND